MNVEFIEDGHVYLVDGIITPSVSEILHFIFPNKYDGVNDDILSKKAEYGTLIHSCIELLEKGKKLPEIGLVEEFSINQYKRLKEKCKIEVLSQEEIINYKDEYCGRLDMIARIDGRLCLCDIKTTSELDLEYLSWQLSFYELAYSYKFGTNMFDKLYCIWLPKKGYGKLVEAKRKTTSELLEKLKEFKESRG